MAKAKSEAGAVRVLLVEDHAIVREGLRALLDAQDDIEVVGQAADGERAIKLAADVEPDLVVLDIALPKLDGVEVTRRITEHRPSCKVVILSMHGDDEVVSAAFQAGATGYVVKDEATSELIDAVHAVAAGKLHVSPMATRALVQTVRGGGGATGGGRFELPAASRSGRRAATEGDGDGASGAAAAATEPEARSSPLSPRERQVLKLVAAGLSTKQVAYKLKISPKTADAHRQALMRKLDIHDVAGLVKYALREGYIELS